MTMRAPAIFAMLLWPMTALASPETPMTAPLVASAEMPNAEQLALARQIIAIVMPADQADAMVERMMGALLGPMYDKLGSRFDADPGLKAIWSDYRHDLTTTMNESMRALLPDMRNAYAMAYAHHFTQVELSQILAFGKTSAGAKYLSRSSELLQDPGIRALMVQGMTEAGAKVQPLSLAFQAKVKAYYAAHPDLAKP